jgi:carbon monoxide dehydrogenase subunit G
MAAFKGTYDGKVGISNQTPPHSFDLRIEGNGRPGFVKGVGHITLEPEGPADQPTATLVRVEGDAQVGGPVLSVGSRLVVPTAKLLMSQFFEAMQRRLAAPTTPS